MSLREFRKYKEPGFQAQTDVRTLSAIPEKNSEPDYFDPDKEVSPELMERILAFFPKAPEQLLNVEDDADYLNWICKVFLLFPARRRELEINERHWQVLEKYLTEIISGTFQEHKAALFGSEQNLILFGLLFFPHQMSAYRERLKKITDAEKIFNADYKDLAILKFVGSTPDAENLKAQLEEHLKRFTINTKKDDWFLNSQIVFTVSEDLLSLKLLKPEVLDKNILQQVFTLRRATFTRMHNRGGVRACIDAAFQLMLLSCDHVEFTPRGMEVIPPGKTQSLENKFLEQPQALNL